MIRLITYICALAVGLWCASAMSSRPEVVPCCRADVLTIFFTGSELGALKPCGCSGRQLGGLDRRKAVFDTTPRQKTLIVDTGNFVETGTEQNLIKFNIIIEALDLLDYDLVNLTKKDAEIAQNLGLLDGIGSRFNVITAGGNSKVKLPEKFTKKFSLGRQTITVTVAAFDVKSQPTSRISQLFPLAVRSDLRTVDILLLNRRDTAAIDEIDRMGIVDCFIVPSDSDQPRLISRTPPCGNPDPNKVPMVFSVGRFNRYVSKLQIRISKGRLKLGFSAVPVTEELPQQQSLVELYKAYQQLVKQANLLEKYPRFTLPNGLEYAGSKSCKSCHEYEYEKCRQNPHAHAYAALERVGSQFDPQCAICHVVGLKYESGFISLEQTPHLKDVGCESCHGPGSQHITTLGLDKTTGPKTTCRDCHTPETSSNYPGNEQLYLKKISHWREPKPSEQCQIK